jgi:uncharacterized protein (UPF0332 family)
MTRITQLLQLAQDELATANLLMVNDRYRACISRSYYAMYHATQALLTSKTLSSKTHKGSIQLFGQHFIKTGELPIDLARALSDTYDLRQLSDYEETVLLTQAQAETILTSAQAFVAQAEAYCGPSP